MRYASMGPHPVGYGNAADRDGRARRLYASMGPHPVGYGNRDAHGVQLHVPDRFNGAAPRRVRKQQPLQFIWCVRVTSTKSSACQARHRCAWDSITVLDHNFHIVKEIERLRGLSRESAARDALRIKRPARGSPVRMLFLCTRNSGRAASRPRRGPTG